MFPVRLKLSWKQALTGTLLFSSCSIAAVTGREPYSYESELAARAAQMALGQEREWRNLLFYIPRLLKGESSVIDSPSFFLSPSGASDPEQELTATLSAFFRPVAASYAPLPHHPRCSFPARFAWLSEKLGIDTKRMPPVACPEVDEFLREFEVDKVSLVFSSAYLNNPASMFGHTFLRFHRAVHGATAKSPLLDPAVNYAANPNTANPLLYAASGLTGGFQGQFSMMPYYLKVQEYNNHETRDMWEYELNLSPNQVTKLMLSLWETGPNYANYFYLDENCSFMMLALLRVADANLPLVETAWPWTIPSDTVRLVTGIKGLVRTVRYRPSSASRFLGRFELLTQSEKALVPTLLDQKESPSIGPLMADLSPESRAQVMDATLEYIDFEEKLATVKEAKSFGRLRVALLGARAATDVPPLALESRPDSERPDLGHGSFRVGMAGGVANTSGGFVDLDLRPALHDLGANPRGYSEQLQLSFLNARLRFTDRSFFLKRFDLANILSLVPRRPLLTPLSWKLQLGWESLACGDEERCSRFHVQGGVGVSFRPLSAVTTYGIILADVGLGSEPRLGTHAGAGAQVGWVAGLTDQWRWTAMVRYLKRYGGRSYDDLEMETEVIHSFSPEWETRLLAAWRNRYTETGLALFYYF